MSTLAGFRDKLQALINEHSMENGSDTPDFILAHFLMGCLAGFDKAVSDRESWYGRIGRLNADSLDADAAPLLRSLGVNPSPLPVMRPENDDDE